MTDKTRPASPPRWLPPPAALLVLAVGGAMFWVVLAKGIQDADYFWHVTTGRIIATTREIPAVDPFSFTWGGQPWVLHEWLSELLMYGLVSAVGTWGAIAVFGLMPLAIFAVLTWILRSHGVSVQGIAAALTLAALVLMPYVTIRPQAISWMLLSVLIAFLWWLRPERAGWALALGPFFVLWANLHGLWVVGLGVVAVYALFTLAGRTGMSPRRGWVVAGTVAAVAGTALTPAGLEGVLYPLRYVSRDDWGLANIEEWQSPDFRDPRHLGLLALILAVGLNGGLRTPGWLVALSWLGVVMALLALRNAPIAAVFSVPTLAMGIDQRLRHWGMAADRARSTRMATSRRLMEIGLVVIVIVAAALVALPRSPGAAPDPDRLPVAGIDVLLAVRPDARVLVEYGWGGYAIYRLYDGGGRVFVDGRNDMYDDAILHAYSDIRAARGDWSALLDAYGVEAILLPPTAPLVDGPAQQDAWCEAYRDAVQVLLLRECPAVALHRHATDELGRGRGRVPTHLA